MQALGLIETHGLLPAIECADVMLKTAQVELLGKTFVGAGLVTITITGDVGAVKAAVEAGVTAVEKIGPLSLVSHHVIPRPHQEIESMVGEKANPVEEQPIPVATQEKSSFLSDADPTANIIVPLPNQDTATESTEPAKTRHESIESAQIVLNQLCKERVDAFVKEFGLEKSLDVLRTITVVKLRNLAREYKELGIAGRAISKADKDLLIQKLKGYYEQEIQR
ncbi:BMC domain-containing protein [Desulfosporosinus nitroreducens]|uniref:BMC domain-containing protein n=1 Tax=Desulfosporosinus nitroreducens TaxID=2018668 RepID=A0ABT8QLF9_9FIRM|nr:BMC domain-containing protein [Desulfosporosinus nitroreducens]MCO1603628.1 BMC domain-containing protein [Desulfosporosinus nitroreducens]MDO0822159.1 BMC domain-containing protein [Desulfosporosinus nitroreducens]